MFHFRKKLFPLVVSVILYLTLVSVAAASSSTRSVPTIDADGLLQQVTKNKGKIIVINIFASWCPPCRQEIPGLIELRKKFSENDVMLIGISVDKVSKALYRFMEDYDFNYPIYLSEGAFEAAVGVTAIPQLLIYDKAGELLTNHKGLVPQAVLTEVIEKLLK